MERSVRREIESGWMGGGWKGRRRRSRVGRGRCVVYFAVNGVHYGPVGPNGQVTSNLALSVDNLTTSYAVADLTADSDLADVVRVAEMQVLTPTQDPDQ